MAGIKKRLGSLLGPEGQVPQFIQGTTTSQRPSEPARVDLTKTGEAEYRVDFHIPRGLDGDPTAVADLDESTAALAKTNGTALRGALNTQIGQSFDVHLIGLWGQSNMSGRGREFTEMTDPEHPRIFQVGFKDRTLRVASEPLDMQDTPSGMGPGLQFARHYLKNLPPNDVVVLAPAALGGTALSTDSAGGWRWGVPSGRSAVALTHLQDALAMASDRWPSAKARVAAILWHQGESDSSDANPIRGEVYQADLDSLIDGARAALEEPELPFIIGQMLPEAMGVGTREEINGVQQNTPYRVPYTGFSMSAPEGYSNGDRLHFNASGQRINAENMFNEFLRVRSGLIPVNPEYVPPTRGKVIWEDTFDRADADTLGDTETAGFTWSTVKTADKGSFHGIRSNAVAHVSALPSGGTIISYVDSGTADGYLEANVTVTDSLFRLGFRVQDADNYLSLYVTPTEMRLRVFPAGSGLDTQPLVSRYPDGGPVGIMMKGDQITLYDNGRQVGEPMTIPVLTTSTWHGVQTADAATVENGRITSIQFRELVQD